MRAKSTKRKHLSISLHIFISMIALCLVLIASLWLFQAMFLRIVFRTVKESTVSQISSNITSKIDDPNLGLFLKEQSSQYGDDIGIAIVPITEGFTEDFLHIHGNTEISSVNGNANKEELTSLLRFAYQSESHEYITGNDFELIFVKLAGKYEDGTPSHMIIINTDTQPPALTKFAFHILLLLISVLALAVSVAISFIISRRISAPISQIYKKAKGLSLYDYDVTFDEKGPREICELAGALNSATGELKKLSATQKELIANISHDLRTPLTMISGYSEVMRDFPDEVTPENMQIIIDETARLNSLVNDLLTVSKLQSDTQSINMTKISLTKTVLDTVKRYEKLLEHKSYLVTFDYDCEVFVQADETRLLQVVYNLVNNAINYTGEDKTVRIVQEVTDDVVRISVIDSGEGISEENLPLIWDRYYKIDKVHKRAINGTGLGLSIVKNILLLHGSRFGVSSEIGVGSTFWFEFLVEEKREHA